MEGADSVTLVVAVGQAAAVLVVTVQHLQQEPLEQLIQVVVVAETHQAVRVQTVEAQELLSSLQR